MTILTGHKHRTANSATRPYTGPVRQPARPAAHGGVCVVERCACGAERRANVNQRFVEQGPWIRPVTTNPSRDNG